MENETKQVIKHKNMDIFHILKQTIIIYFKNINFILFTFLTSLPYFFLMLYFETLFQQTVVQTPQIISSLPFLEKNPIRFQSISITNNILLIDVPSFSEDYLPVLLQLALIYTFPLHFLEFCSTVITMKLSSKLISSDNKMSLKDMFQNSIDISMMIGTFITSLYVLTLSNCLLIAFPWTVSNCYSLFSVFGLYLLVPLICCVAVGKLLMVYLEWSAIWNMSIVISVLDGIYGVGALRVSYFFSSGNRKRGLLLMLVFFVFGICLRLICIYFECYKGGNGIFLQIGILTVVNTLKWVSCVIYFNDCKERKLEKIADLEKGKVKLESNAPKE
ncbi:uncharacterized protein [Cicer arietinum]|uniref:Uncharacterized protein LOC101514280 n=1 Tax=Cicer arietinum TaxID=3827 RepID=A0A1S2YFM1_CICAR|nr:uncharacterized protein LOC101514280 [Cicer arietinum]